mgnify:CR=1 FL=1
MGIVTEMTDLEAMGRQISEVDEWLSELAATRRFLADVLRPFWDEDARIRNSIARTHENIDGEGGVFVVGWRRLDRSAMFSRLDALNAEYASFKVRYSENGMLMKHATKSRKRITDAIEREKRRLQNKVIKAQLELL